MTVRWAVAGCSGIADVRVAPAIAHTPDAELVGFSSHDPARARAFAARHSAPRAYDSFEALLADDSIDVVYVGGHNAVHAAQTIAAARAGRHVLCEKPIATHLTDARAMIDTCAQNDRLLGINHHLRGAATHAAMRETIASGSIGTPLFARVSFPVLLPTDARTWRLDAAADGGVLLDIGTHVVDLLRWLLNTEIESVSCIARQQTFKPGAEDVATATLMFASGCLGMVYMAYNAPNGIMGIDIQGSSGSLRAIGTLDQLPGGQVFLRDDGGDHELTTTPVDLYERHVQDFCAAVSGRGNALASGEDGFHSLEAALALRSAAAEGVVVSLSSQGVRT
jgi:1,5-anhydro-D-fructose reductase (1,5-anhydro-D-mannitol-forming)